MPTDIGARIQLEGEAQFKQAVRDIDKSMAVLGSELQKVSAQFGTNADSMDALRAKQEVYNKQIDEHEKKIETLRDALEKSAKEYGDNDAKTKNWQIALNKAEAELAKTENSLRQTTEQMVNATKVASEYEKAQERFNQSTKDISSVLSLLGSELTKIDAKYGGNKNSVEALTEKNKVLNEIYAGQREKCLALEGAVDRATKEYGKGSEEVNKLKIALNNAAAEMYKTGQEIDVNAKKLDELGKEADIATKATDKYADKTDDAKKSGMGFGDVLDKLSNKLGVQLPENTKNSMNSLGQIDATSLMLVGTFAALAAAIVKVEQALIDMTKQSAAYVDEILTMSAKTGIAVDALQEYSYAAELLDVDVETITGSQTKLIRAMENAADGSKSQADAFRQLGVQFKNSDGTLRDSEETFWDIIDALGAMKNDTERDAVAMDLMGKSAQDLNPLIKAGSDEMKKYAQEARNVGYVLSNEQVNALGKVDDAMQRYNKTLDATKNMLSAQFAPYLEKAMTNLGDFVSKLGTSLEQSGIVKAFGMLLETISNLISPSDTMARSTIPGLVNALKPLAQITATLADTIGVIANLLTGNFRGASQSLGFLYQYGKGNNYQNLMDFYQQTDINAATVKNGYGQYYANGKWYANYDQYLRDKFEESGVSGTFEYWKMVNGYNAAGTDFFRGGYTWVGENGPELVSLPEGSRITPASESADVGGDTFYVNIDAKNVKEFNDIVDMAKTARMRARKR